jgi:hypothetical protein
MVYVQMTRDQALVAALEISQTYLQGERAVRDPRGISMTHLRWMVEQMTWDMSENKTMRWLGYVQGVLVSRGAATLDEMKDVNKRATGK